MVDPVSSIGSNVILFGVITIFILLAVKAKVNVYESFIDGAKEGFQTAVSIIPYLVAMLSAIAVFRACGALDSVFQGLKYTMIYFGFVYTEFIDALPVAFMKPFS